MLRVHFPARRSTTSNVPFSKPARNRRLPCTSTSMWSRRPFTFGMEIVWTSRSGCFTPSWEPASAARPRKQNTTAQKRKEDLFIVSPHSIFWCVNPQRGALLRACGHRQIQAVSFLIPEAGSRSDRGRYFCQWPVMISVSLLDDAHEPLSSKRIYAFPAGVEIDIVRIGDTGHARNHCPALCIEHDDLCGFSRHYEEAVIGFVQSHRIVRLSGF